MSPDPVPDSGDAPPPESDGPPQYTKYRARPPLLARFERGKGPRSEPERAPGGPRRRFWRGPWTWKRALAYLVTAIVAWVVLSFVLFMLSAGLQSGSIDSKAKAELAGGGFPPFTPTTVLVLGSDARPKGSKEGGAHSGPSRSDSILLLRVGGGHNSRLSIPRDTVVDIPGHGRNKINAAYAFGGQALAIQTVEQYLGLKIDHLVSVSFTNFPHLIDAMGGVDYTGGCVVSRINGGFKNGGFTLRLKKGTTHIDGKQALALSRTRENLCNTKENDLTRERRQQKLIAAMKSRLLSPTAFLRLPLIAWNAPKALVTDMGGPTLLGLFSALAVGGSPKTRVLRPSGGVTLPDGGSALVVSDAEKQRAVRAFMAG